MSIIIYKSHTYRVFMCMLAIPTSISWVSYELIVYLTYLPALPQGIWRCYVFRDFFVFFLIQHIGNLKVFCNTICTQFVYNGVLIHTKVMIFFTLEFRDTFRRFHFTTIWRTTLVFISNFDYHIVVVLASWNYVYIFVSFKSRFPKASF